MSISVLLRGTVKEIGEGPHWDGNTKSLLYTDMWAGDVHKWDSVTGEDTKLHLGDDVSFIIPRKSGGYVVSCDQKIGFLDWTSGKFDEVARISFGKPIFRINDGKCDPAGRLWTGTMHAVTDTSKSLILDHVLCSLDVDHKLTIHKYNTGLSNGLAWTGDTRTMFYSDSVPRVIYAYNYDVTTGEISNERTAIKFAGPEDFTVSGLPDGLCIDADDKLWVACFRAGRVVRFDPETGKQLQIVRFPTAQHTTSCCFGGANLDELYVTCSVNKFGLETTAAESVDAGCIFKVTGLNVKGRTAFTYGG
jgi:gluconolactonase